MLVKKATKNITLIPLVVPGLFILTLLNSVAREDRKRYAKYIVYLLLLLYSATCVEIMLKIAPLISIYGKFARWNVSTAEICTVLLICEMAVYNKLLDSVKGISKHLK